MRVETYLRHPQPAETVPSSSQPHAGLRPSLHRMDGCDSRSDTPRQSIYVSATEFHSDRLSGCPLLARILAKPRASAGGTRQQIETKCHKSVTAHINALGSGRYLCLPPRFPSPDRQSVSTALSKCLRLVTYAGYQSLGKQMSYRFSTIVVAHVQLVDMRGNRSPCLLRAESLVSFWDWRWFLSLSSTLPHCK
jgi:hypothetical protein